VTPPPLPGLPGGPVWKGRVEIHLEDLRQAALYYGFYIPTIQTLTSSDLVREFYDIYLKSVGYIPSLFDDRPETKTFVLYRINDEDKKIPNPEGGLFKNRLEISDRPEDAYQINSAFRFASPEVSLEIFDDLQDPTMRGHAFQVLFFAQRWDIFEAIGNAGFLVSEYLPVVPDMVYGVSRPFTPFLRTMLREGSEESVLDLITSQIKHPKYSFTYSFIDRLVGEGDFEAVRLLVGLSGFDSYKSRPAVQKAHRQSVKLHFDDISALLE
jgi:hypothetical protein